MGYSYDEGGGHSPMVAKLVDKYVDRLRDRIINPAIDELEKLRAKFPRDRALVREVRFVRERMMDRMRRVESHFSGRPSPRRKSK